MAGRENAVGDHATDDSTDHAADDFAGTVTELSILVEAESLFISELLEGSGFVGEVGVVSESGLSADESECSGEDERLHVH